MCEFLSLTETNEAITTVMSNFKDMNPAWKKMEAFIIDKDFTEWKVLKTLFEDARVSGCCVCNGLCVGLIYYL